MDLTEAERLARKLMKRHGLPGWQFAFDYEKRADGVCHFNVDLIALNPAAVERGDEVGVRAIILHEIAHGLVGPGHGHDAVWHAKLVELIRKEAWGE